MIPEWSVKNRVAVNLFTVTLLIAGMFAAATRLERDLFPDITTNFISITTLDPTTSLPADIERTITVPIEEELAEVEGITEVTSTSQDNLSRILVEVESEIEDIDPILNDIRQAVDKAEPELPATAEPPVVESFDIPFPLVNFTVAYPRDFDVRKIRENLDRIERRLKITRGVSDVLVDGLEDREVWIEINPYKLQRLGISFAEVAQAVQRKNRNVVGGRLDSAGGQRVVRVLGEARQAEDLLDLPVREAEGKIVYLRDVATVEETTEEAETSGRVNLQPAVTFTVVKKKGADAIQTAQSAREVFEEERALLPPEVETQIVADSTKYINTRIETVLQNGVQALVLVTLLLLLLLNWRLAIVVALGLPISFAGVFLVLYVFGYTINLLSLFAMIMALGMVVDDAVVIAENVYRYYQNGYSPVKAAVRGTNEVMWPVVGSVSTTVAAFLPLIWGEGIIGKFLAIVPVVVISALVFSLFQAFVVVPSHLSDFLRKRLSREQIVERLKNTRNPLRKLSLQIALTYNDIREVTEAMMRSAGEIYMHLLNITLRRRYLVLLGSLLVLIAVFATIPLGVVRFELFDIDFADRIMVKLELPADYTLRQTEEKVAEVEEAIVSKLPPTDLVALVTRVGAQLDAADEFLEYGSNIAMITVDIDEQNEARKPSLIEADLREVLREFPAFTRAVAKAEQGGPPVGRPVNVEILGPDFEVLRNIASAVKEVLHDIPGVVNIADNFPRGKTEYRVRVREDRAAQSGVDIAAIAESLLAGFRGIEAAKLRWGNDEVVIRVKMDERFAQDPEVLKSFRIRNSRGENVDLSTVADLQQASGIARISRLNQERALTVSADVEEEKITSAEANKILKTKLPEILENFPGYEARLTGENEDTAESLDAMVFAAVVALLLIYALLATITNSFAQPLVIMSVIPFAVIGVIIGLIFMGASLGLMSIMGTIALAGIVVNNSVVFVDFINRYRHEHDSRNGFDPQENPREQPARMHPWARWRSIMHSGKVRYRPIFLTTASTVVGLLSLAFVSSGQEQFLAPMAQAIVWGLSFASLITMILIPCLYAILDDLRALPARLRLSSREEKPQTEPAPA